MKSQKLTEKVCWKSSDSSSPGFYKRFRVKDTKCYDFY